MDIVNIGSLNPPAGEFTQLFGEEGLRLLDCRDEIEIIIANSKEVEGFVQGQTVGFAGEFCKGRGKVVYGEGDLVIGIFRDTLEKLTEGLPKGFGYRVRNSYLAHELVHYYQMKTGQLVVLSPNEYIWEGTLYTVESIDDFLEAPWERIAYMEQYRYLNHGKEREAKAAYENMKRQVRDQYRKNYRSA